MALSIQICYVYGISLVLKHICNMLIRSVIFTANFSNFHIVLVIIFCEMNIQRYMKRKDGFDEVDEQQA